MYIPLILNTVNKLIQLLPGWSMTVFMFMIVYDREILHVRHILWFSSICCIFDSFPAVAGNWDLSFHTEDNSYTNYYYSCTHSLMLKKANDAFKSIFSLMHTFVLTVIKNSSIDFTYQGIKSHNKLFQIHHKMSNSTQLLSYNSVHSSSCCSVTNPVKHPVCVSI